MAIKALAWMVRSFDPPVYCYHEIVHNKIVVQRFEDQGVIFVDDIAEVPPGRPIMLSAHGSAPEVVAAAPRSISLVESVAEVEALPQFTEPVALLAQTTLSHRDWADVAHAVHDRYPDAWMPGRSDLCFATTNRQSALMAMAPRCDAIV